MQKKHKLENLFSKTPILLPNFISNSLKEGTRGGRCGKFIHLKPELFRVPDRRLMDRIE